MAKRKTYFDTVGKAIAVAVKRLDGFVNYQSSLGVEGSDPVKAAIVDLPRHLNDDDLVTLWRDSPYAMIGVDDLAHTATRKGWKVTTTEPMPPALNVDASDLACDVDDDWSIWLLTRRAIIFGRLLGLGVIIPVLDDGLPPSAPLDLNRPYRLLNLIVADKRELTPLKWQGDMTKRGYNEPELWSYTSRGAASGTISLTIHASRLIKFGGRDVPRDIIVNNNGADDSVLRPAYDAIQHKSTFDDSRAVLINDFKVDVITSPDIDSIATGDAQLEYIDERMGLLAKGKSLLNMLVLDGSETYAKSSTSVAGVADLDDRTSNELGAALRMPQTRLFGEAPGGLNTDGESQQKNWNDQSAAWQRLELRPQLVQLYRLIFGALNGPTKGYVPKKFYVEFEPLDEPSEKQRAELRKVTAETDAIYLDRGVISSDHVAKGRFGEGSWTVDLPPAEVYVDESTEAPSDVSSAGGESAPTEPQTELSLNGAQIQSMVAITTAVSAGQIPEESGQAILEAAFGLSPQAAKRIAGTFKAAPNPAPVAPLTPENPENA